MNHWSGKWLKINFDFNTFCRLVGTRDLEGSNPFTILSLSRKKGQRTACREIKRHTIQSGSQEI